MSNCQRVEPTALTAVAFAARETAAGLRDAVGELNREAARLLDQQPPDPEQDWEYSNEELRAVGMSPWTDKEWGALRRRPR